MQNNDYYAEQKELENSQNKEADLGTFKSVKTLKEAYDCLRKSFTQKSMELAQLKKENDIKENFEEVNETDFLSKATKNINKSDKNEEKIEKIEDKVSIDENSTEDLDMSDKIENIPDDTQTSVDKVKEIEAPTTSRFEGEDWQNSVQHFFLENDDARQFATEIGRIIMQDRAVRESVNPLDKAWIRVLKNNSNPQISENEMEKFVLQNSAIKQKIIDEYLTELQHKKSAPKVIADRIGTQVNATKTPRVLNMTDAKELAKKILIK